MSYEGESMGFESVTEMADEWIVSAQRWKTQERDAQHGLCNEVQEVYDFRNKYVAHQEGGELTDAKLAERSLVGWIKVLQSLNANTP